MTSAVPILLARLLIPAAMIVFAISFYLGVATMARSEKLFPIVLIVGVVTVTVGIVAQELYRLFVSRRNADSASLASLLDADGLRTVGWSRSILIAGACLLYLFTIQRLGVMLTGFLVYLACAVPLIPDRSVRKHWLYALIGAIVAGVLFDVVFRVWLGLPLPGYSL